MTGIESARWGRLVLAAALCLLGCRPWRGGDVYKGRARQGEARYGIGDPGTGWRPLPPLKGLQAGWANRSLGAVIDVHSRCDEHGDSSLEQFTDHLRIDWTEWKVVSQEEERLVGRAALRTVVDAELDGVSRRLELVLVKKNGCLFDLRYVAKPESYTRGRAAFQSVVRGFAFPVGAGG